MRATPFEIGVIGAGNAAEGIVHSILRNTVLFDERMIASDPAEARRELFARRFNIAVTDDNRNLVENSYILILAVKPQQFAEVGKGIADLIRAEHLIVSIMAGVSTATIEAAFAPTEARVVRAMPNLPVHVGAGVAGICRGKHAQEVDLLRAQRIFEAGGRCIVLDDEDLMDAVTAVSGSGPAYFYYFVEMLTAAGEQAGLSRPQAEALAKHACLGAAKMMIESGDPPNVLREKVTSPGGTTQAALETMQKHGVFDHVVEGVLAAWRRGRELGR
ncbi:MAG: pyrroline-5-carboxylate reductase [Phycisphaerae bacterium]|nr:pyrroline-5-carboxylate reductase [Phycisphaerae bacterium]